MCLQAWCGCVSFLIWTWISGTLANRVIIFKATGGSCTMGSPLASKKSETMISHWPPNLLSGWVGIMEETGHGGSQPSSMWAVTVLIYCMCSCSLTWSNSAEFFVWSKLIFVRCICGYPLLILFYSSTPELCPPGTSHLPDVLCCGRWTGLTAGSCRGEESPRFHHWFLRRAWEL